MSKMLSQKCTYGNNNNYYFNSYYSFNGIYCFTDVNVIDVNDLHDDNGFDSDNDSIDVNRVSDFNNFNNFNDVNVKKCEKLRKYSYRKLPNFCGEIRRLWRPLTAKLCNTGGCSKALQTGKDVRNNICHDW